MDFAYYQQEAEKTAIYPDRLGMGGLAYAALGLANEAGEVAGKVKKILRDHGGVLNLEAMDAIAAELGDVLWYLAAVATEVDAHLEIIAQDNLDKLTSRQQRGVLQGSGDNR